jgi:uncharacterized protein (TIGR03066 family)
MGSARFAATVQGDTIGPTSRTFQPGDRMRTLRPLLAIGLALVLVSVTYAQGKTKDLIVGKWEMSEKKDGKELKVTMDFAKDGKVKVGVSIDNMAAFNLDGTYEVPDDETVALTFMGKTDKAKVKINDKEMSITGGDGKTNKLTRVK